MTRLVLVAASGLAREVLAVEEALYRYTEVVVLDDDPTRWGTTLATAPILGGLDLLPSLEPCDVVLCAGRGTARRSLVRRLVDLSVGPDRYATVIHPSVQVPLSCTVGEGSILLAQVALTSDVRVGSHVVVMPHVTLTHDVVLEDFATVCAGVSLGGNVTVREAAYVGMNAGVRERVTVGREASLGMGAALLADLPDGETWVGVPARPLRGDGDGNGDVLRVDDSWTDDYADVTGRDETESLSWTRTGL